MRWGVATFIVLAIGCGGRSPSGPSATTTAQTAVSNAVTQAVSQAAAFAPLAGDVVNTVSIACPEGGSMVISYSAALPTGPTTTISTGSRTEFNDCRMQGVTLRGDPNLQTAGEHTWTQPPGGSGPASSTGIMRTTGGIRFDGTGIQGRAQYNCTMSVNVQFNGTTPQVAISSTGTISWEQPLGTVTTRPCGPG